MTTHKTSAWPLSLIYAGLIVYASLYPFTDWRDQGPAPWAFLASPWPAYWTGFDLLTNVLGYAPLGFLLGLSALRTGRGRRTVLVATAGAAGLSLVLESMQSYLPARVPSNLDWALNTGGAVLGALVASLLERRGAIDRWNQFRARWFVEQSRGALVLMALWPVALLFPAAVPLGLGQVLERTEAALGLWLKDTPFLEWLPQRTVELQPLLPLTELVCVLLGTLIPCLLGFGIMTSTARRLVYVVTVLVAGIGATLLSWALSYGPAHAWSWLSLPVQVGLVLGFGGALLLVRVSGRYCTVLLLLALGLYLVLINQGPSSAYFAQTLQAWEQGRFIRFHGMVQWLAWLWPYAVLAYALARLAGAPEREPTMQA